MTVSLCQRCQEEITVPPRLAPASEVQCPLCQEMFKLAEVLSAAPPTLIVVNAVPSAEAESGSEESEQAGFGSGSAPGGFSLADGPTGGEGLGELSLASGEGSSFTPSSSSTTASAGAGSRSQSRKRKGKNPVVEILKVVLGGVFGLGGGYFILLWLFGVNAVPELTNTISRYASFAVPAKFHDPSLKSKESSSQDGGSGDEATDALASSGTEDNPFRAPVETQAAVFGNDSEGLEGEDTTGPDLEGFDFSNPNTVLDSEAGDSSTDGGTEEATDGTDVTNSKYFVAAPPRVTLETLTAAVEQAEATLEQWGEAGASNSQQQAAQAMAALGQLLPYADREHEQVKGLLPRVAALMKQFTDADKRNFWFEETDSRLGDQATKPTSSIGFLSLGKVGETSPEGDVFVTPVQLAGPAKNKVLIVSQTAETAPPNEKIICLLGEVIAEPAKRITGYGQQEQLTAVLAHFVDLRK